MSRKRCWFVACPTQSPERCNNISTECIGAQDFCDGIVDCVGQEDETNCTAEQTITCQNGATRQDGVEFNTCNCSARYTGDLCETDLGACSMRPCQNGGQCVQPGLNDTTEFSCICIEFNTSGDLCEVGKKF